ncbi:MAG TPA: (deoxy)nucleoside triphosphate pyrophosphohydrolase [Candidatus Acidoferrales bacterium]|nr:(deoxy)nucleoside triphosphate pyrophosphohydrolase [Candidatus Acidoferrales bacterium]
MLVVAAVIVREGRVLTCQRSRSGKFPLKWEFPGGKVQSDESPEAALARELREELSVNASVGAEICRTRHKYPEMPSVVELIFFAATIDSGEVDNRVFEATAWVAPQKLPEMDFLDADRELISKLATGGIQLQRVTDAKR